MIFSPSNLFLVRKCESWVTFRLIGNDREKWLNGMVTCDISGWTKKEANYGFVCEKNGKLIGDLWIVPFQNEILVVAHEGLSKRLIQHFEKYIIMEDVDVHDLSTQFEWFLLFGELSETTLKDFSHFPIFAKTPLLHPAFLVAMDCSSKMQSNLVKNSEPFLALSSNDEWEQFRIEGKLPLFGVDFDVTNYPEETSLETVAVSFQKGCYIGQEVIFMLHTRGHVQKKLVKIEMNSETKIDKGTAITCDSKNVGVITSVAPFKRNGKTIALGYLKYKTLMQKDPIKVANVPAEFE